MSNGYTRHWDAVFTEKPEHTTSWFQPYPFTAMGFLKTLQLPQQTRFIDVGGGDSRFADALLDEGYTNITVLDIAKPAIDRAKERLGKRADRVQWMVSDILNFEPHQPIDFWHDRAAFHFLTTDHFIEKYVGIAAAAITKNGYLLVSTFAENGPKQCGGLPVQNYSEVALIKRFEAAFEPIKCGTESHTTPTKAVQQFQYCLFRRK